MKLSREELNSAIDRAILEWTRGIDEEEIQTKYKPLHEYIGEAIEEAEKNKGG